MTKFKDRASLYLVSLLVCVSRGCAWISCENPSCWSSRSRIYSMLPPIPETLKQSGHRIRDRSSTTELSESDFLDISPFVVAGVALGLGVAAQGFINQMLKGDQGLGAFLKDGSGYNKSGYRQQAKGKPAQDADPLPWLKLPRLDFVEVAGQTSRQEENMMYDRLEDLREQMNVKLDEDKIEDASALREELETLMSEVGFEYNSEP